MEVWLGRELQGTWQALACITYDEQMRPDAAAAVAALQHAGIALTLLSGDRPERAHRLSQQLGIADVVAAARPEDKVAAVASAQAKGERVGMLGDGVNDAPVLALADVSLAMGQGALVSRVHADAVVVSNRLSDVVWAYRLSHKAVRIVRQNLIWAATYNMVCIPLALMGYLPVGRRIGHGFELSGRDRKCAEAVLYPIEQGGLMDILFLLIPLSAVLILAIIGVFGWALNKGQFDDLEREGERILQQEPPSVDADQA
ncbi:cbb3-type cytochrome oxidase assembly protein CcoS [Ideonella paludis]